MYTYCHSCLYIPANSKRQKFMPREERIAFPPSESLLPNLLHKCCAGSISSLFTSGGPILPKFGSSTCFPINGTSRQVPTLAQPCFFFAEVSDSADCSLDFRFPQPSWILFFFYCWLGMATDQTVPITFEDGALNILNEGGGQASSANLIPRF